MFHSIPDAFSSALDAVVVHEVIDGSQSYVKGSEAVREIPHPTGMQVGGQIPAAEAESLLVLRTINPMSETQQTTLSHPVWEFGKPGTKGSDQEVGQRTRFRLGCRPSGSGIVGTLRYGRDQQQIPQGRSRPNPGREANMDHQARRDALKQILAVQSALTVPADTGNRDRRGVSREVETVARAKQRDRRSARAFC